MSKEKAPKRRTQQERRDATIRRLFDATTDTLIESGYSGASVQRICEKAGLSHGALFRHFKTTDELMIAVGEDVGAQLLSRYRTKFQALPRNGDLVTGALRLLRDTCRSRLNQAWYELAIASRTNDTLRAALEPVAKRYYADICALAAELMPELSGALGPAFGVLVRTVISTFDGEVVEQVAGRTSQKDQDARITVLAAAIQALLAQAEGKRFAAGS